MHDTIRQCAGKGGLMGGLAPRVRDGLVPRKRAPGFKGCCAVASEDRHVVSAPFSATARPPYGPTIGSASGSCPI